MQGSATVAERSVLVLIPSFNDGASAVRVAADVARLGPRYRPLVVDDGSRVAIDRRDLPEGALLFRCPFNAGIGVATLIAFDHALAHEYPVVVRIDGDGQHPVEGIPELVDKIDRDDADIVAGSRVNHGDGDGVLNLLRRAAKLYYSAWASLLTGGRAPIDVNTGFFAANRKAVRFLVEVDLERFPEPQMFVSACRSGLRIGIVPTAQKAREHGVSTLNPWHALRMFYRFNIFVLGEIVSIGRQWPAR